MSKKKFNIEILRLCNKYKIDSEADLSKGYIYEYKSKDGKEYNDILLEVFGGENKNDKPFTVEQIIEQPKLSEFSFDGKNDFIFICDLVAEKMIVKTDKTLSKIDKKPEKIIPINFAGKNTKDIFYKELGVSYMLTAIIDNEEYIIKIGQSRTTFKDRLQSYNCGNVNNWRTASTTNIKILQSMLSTQKIFRLYICLSGEPITFNFHGVTSSPFASPKSLAIEEIMIKKFKEQFGKVPLANIQANPTTIKKK